MSALLLALVPWRRLAGLAALLLLSFALFFASLVDVVAHAVAPFLNPPWSVAWIPTALGSLGPGAALGTGAAAASGAAATPGGLAVTLGQPVPGEPSLAWPLSGPVTSPFGPRIDPLRAVNAWHDGIDIAASDLTAVHAAGDGVVAWAGWENARNPAAGYGWFVEVDHGGGLRTRYAHLEPSSSALVRVGDVVRAGQVIGLSGMTGAATGYHLHFEVRRIPCAIDPWPALRPAIAHIHCP